MASLQACQDDSLLTVYQQRALDLLLRLKHEFDPRHLGEACRELTSLVLKHSDCVQILEDYHAHRPVMDMMEHRTYEADIQQAGHEALSAMMSVSNKLRDLIQKRNVHQDVLEIMSKHTTDSGVQTAAMKVITFLAMSANICNTLMEEQILESVVQTMQNFPDDAGLQKVANQALRQLLAEDSSVQVDFVDSKKHHPIITALRNHPGDPGVQEEALWLLAVLADSEENYDILLQENHKLLVTAMRSFPNVEGVQTAGFAFMKAVAINIESQQLLEVNGASQLVLSGIRTFRQSTDIQTLGFSILTKLTDVIFRPSSTSAIEAPAEDNWLPDVFMGLTLHLDNVDCQEAGCSALSKLIEKRPQVLKGIESISIENAVLASLRVHGQREVGIFIASCASVYSLVITSERMRESFMEKGTYMDIQAGMNTHKQSVKAQAVACKACMGLCLFSPEDKEALALVGVQVEIFNALKMYPDRLDVLEAAIGAIACLADVDIVRYQCMVEGIHELILQSMVSHPDNRSIQELALEAMAVLSTADGMAELLCEAGALAYTVETMARYGHFEGIQQKGSILLQALVAEQKSIDNVPVARQVAKALVTAMKKFRHDPNVLAESCVAMQLLAETSKQIGHVFVENDAHEELFYIIETYSSDKVLIDLACECLYVLCWKWDFKKDLLLWACRQNKLKGVEVLLQLSANVNIGKGRETPLCLAVQKGNTDMVKLLLKQGVSDIHTALHLALELHHDTITGLLLQHMGHDKDGGVATWSGLGLTVLQPLWFYPTFLGQIGQASPSTRGNSSTVQIASRIRHTEENRAKRRQAVFNLLSEVDGSLSSNLAPVVRTSSLNILVAADRELYPGSPPPKGSPLLPISPEKDSAQSVFQVGEANATDFTCTENAAFLPDTLDTSAFSLGEEQEQGQTILERPRNHERSKSLHGTDTEVDNLTKAMNRRRQRSAGEMDMIRKVSSSFVPWRKSLSSANLPINPDDPRCLESLQRGLREQSSVRESFSGGSSSRPQSPSLLSIESYINIRSRSQPEIEMRSALSVSQESSEDRYQSPLERSQARSKVSQVFSFGSVSDSSTTDMEYAESSQPSGVMPDVVPTVSPSTTQWHSTPVQRKNRRSSRHMLHLGQSMLDVPEASEIHVHLLDLSANRITDLQCLAQSEGRLMGQFAFLEKLDLSNNALEELPSQFTQALPRLQNLDLRNNQFQTLPVHVFGNGRLQTLDMSGNKINDMTEEPLEVSFSLVDLNLSNNCIEEFPSWIGQYAPALVTLSLARNHLKELPAMSVEMTRLQTLDLSCNELSHIPSKFMWNCDSLDYLNVSCNQLKILPEELGELLCSLTTLKMAANNLALPEPPYIPRMILQLPWLRSIDLSNNNLTGVPPPKEWKSQGLREILLGHNKIKKLDLSESIRPWQKLERLALNNNQLSQVPKEIGQILTLTSLDFSNNPKITCIPDELGKLARLWELPLDGLKLDLDPSILKGRTKDIIGFLNQKLKQSVPYYRMKLMLVGYGGRGKSTLLARLQKQKRSKKEANVATVGIKVSDWKIQVRSNKKTVDFCLNTWDFAGQEDFYSMHPCFLTGRALFLVVYDVSRGPEEVKTLRPWLLTIQALAPSCPVVVVGTHKDKIPKDKEVEFISDMEMRVRSLCQSPGFPEIMGFRVVSCTSENEGLEALRRLVVELIETCKIKGQPVLGQMIPYSYQRLEELLREEARKMKENKEAPVVMRRRLLQLVREHSLQLDNDELSQAVRFLHETGILLHYNDPVQQLKEMYFVDPEWLCKIMALVVTVREINPFISPNGQMRISDLPILFTRTEDLPIKRLLPQYLKLLEKFEVALPITDTELLIPCKMPSQKPAITLPCSSRQDLLHRLYDMPYVPIGLWSRLILRLLVFSTQMLQTPSSVASACNDDISKVTKYWREGIYVCWSREAFFCVESLRKGRDGLKITVPQTKDGNRLLGLLCDHADDLIEEWFPGLTEMDPLQGKTLVQRMVPCVLCEENKNHQFMLDELIERSEVNDYIVCPNHMDMQVPLKLLAPDVMLADLDDRFHIDPKLLQFSPSSSHMLGDGSFGSVYKAKYKDQYVAVKMFGMSPDVHPHRLLRQEVTILRQLQHPSLVSMEGVGLNPRVLVIELAQLGSLASVLRNKKLTSRSLQHRIALQVAEGLMFLHEHRIVYRDLKPDNILIFSLSLGTLHNAKIADYGISKFATPYGLRAPEGTPGYRAPEVIRGLSTYNTEVDIYSFGILLYEMVTGGHKPFEELEFRAELDEAVMKGRQLLPLTYSGVPPWPDLQELIDYCLEHVPQHRPTSEQVFKWLNSAELLCLKREYPLLMDVCVECMAVRFYRSEGVECQEVWLAGGDRKATMVSWIQPLNIDPENSIQGMMLHKGRALCMTAIGEYAMVIGTQCGELCVCDLSSSPYRLKHTLPKLGDAVVCLAYWKRDQEASLLFAGLANGRLAIYKANRLQSDKDCQPDKMLHIGSRDEPIKSITLTRNKIWLAYSSKVISLNIYNLESDTSTVLEPDQEERPAMVKCMAVDKAIWLCRRNSSIIEVWDVSRRKMTHTINVAEFISKEDAAEPSNCYIKSLLLQPRVALWVGTAGGHLILIDTNTHQLVSISKRYTSNLRAMVAVKGHGLMKFNAVIVTSGSGFVRRPPVPEHTDTQYTHVLVWDADLKSQVRYLQSDMERRRQTESQAMKSWHKLFIL
ncbi:leucine-rich repeat serine/threonine-protein kinase 2-like isoform X2 [Acanthaster planci]|uniref:non-specific serine/threonine protein kinase n=1 Tax=Acanthaster planci TaxID=133434 RepID=A0A8B7YWS3_ACAPL|nr:leucine-rich repeat serine/threonine-protein kinase 2-like isoform X2 [Acanthaster planci]XP_022097769.1 leucine-rich repeat serine/threonine-protein kinase 2-like isoform X2 [Acanthaster planci]